MRSDPHIDSALHCRAARRVVLLCTLLLVGLLGGCSAIRTVYNQAEHVIAWRADDYFDLTEDQKRLLRTHLERLHAWHRTTQLRNYASLLDAADRRLSDGPNMPDVRWALAEIRQHSRTFLLHSHADIAALLATLTDAQIAHAKRRFDRDNRRFARERGVGAAPEEQRRLRAKRVLESIEHWSGPLDSEQQARIAALSETLPPDAAFRMHDRLRRQRDFLSVLEARKEEERFAMRLRVWLVDWDASRPPGVEAEASRYTEAYSKMLLQVFDDLRPDQRRRVSERLRWYRDVMRDLALDRRH